MAALASSSSLRGPLAACVQSSLEKCEMLGRPVSLASCAAPLPTASNAPAIAVRCAAKDGKSAAAEPGSASHGHTGQRVVNRRLILGGLAAGMAAVVGCPICDSNGGSSIGAALAADWSKGDVSGPMEWGELCAAGDAKLAIDAPLNATSKLTRDNGLGKITFAYKNAEASFLNTGHGTMQVNFPDGSNSCVVGGRQLQLLQYHFHAPSEHSFNGVRSPMEAHLVHRDADGKLAVIGVMVEADPKAPRNLCLEAALAFSPNERNKKNAAPQECLEVPVVGSGGMRSALQQCLRIQTSPAPLLPPLDRPDGSHAYIHYQGSLADPSCSDAVDWFVLAAPLKVPDSQVLEFLSYVGDRRTLAFNARPRQDLGPRRLAAGTA
ncbi:hypothetical protein CLOM_g14727 [Closterium sp. NIES-68]|nr:hypothetical protein CLOM_g14727 [Closterium sp. NIES-68]GJP81754.1 hypothetical protein CLOP_g11887 [Closterium sp. NIES-67]